jgi:hypothetical protein
MKRKILTTVLIVCCFAAVCIAAVFADMNGKFSGVLNAPDGNQYPLTYTFTVNGDKLTGNLDTSQGIVSIDSGKVSDNNMTFNVTVENRVYAHKGKYFAQGDSISMDVDFAGTKAHTTLQRAK